MLLEVGWGSKKQVYQEPVFPDHLYETVRTEDAREALNWLHTEVSDYWSQHKSIIAILKYLSKLNHIPHMTHWEKDADAALRLAGAVENDHGGRL